MPFGKNKQLAYKRPKKGKVPAREESSENTENAGINGGGQPPPAPACVEQPLAASPGWLKRKQAQVECDDLHIEFEACQRLDAEAEKELHMQERLYEAKQKRIEKSRGRLVAVIPLRCKKSANTQKDGVWSRRAVRLTLRWFSTT